MPSGVVPHAQQTSNESSTSFRQLGQHHMSCALDRTNLGSESTISLYLDRIYSSKEKPNDQRLMLSLSEPSDEADAYFPASRTKSRWITQSIAHFRSCWVKQTISALRNLTISISGLLMTNKPTNRLR